MKYLLAPQQRERLRRCARARLLIAFDFDGTLAPITRAPAAAKLPDSTRLRLQQIASRYACAVISGRARADVASKLAGVSALVVIGNHGIEPSAGMQSYLPRIAHARRTLAPQLSRIAGVELEDKRYSLAIHYRNARNKPAARRAISAALTALDEPVRVVAGKQVLSLLPNGAPHKGKALLALLAKFHANAAIYVGDDITDEDVFALRVRNLLAVRIGRKRDTHASYYLKSQSEIDAFLERLMELSELET